MKFNKDSLDRRTSSLGPPEAKSSAGNDPKNLLRSYARVVDPPRVTRSQPKALSSARGSPRVADGEPSTSASASPFAVIASNDYNDALEE